jgi:hypothetical protein
MRVVIGVVLALSVGIGAYLGSAQAAGSAQAVGCMKASKLKSVFPRARTAGFAGRDRLKVEERGSSSPGFCSAFWTTYYVRSGDGVDVGVALSKSAKDPLRGLAEAAMGPVHRASNGARFKTDKGPANVNGTPAKATDVVSAYRKIYIVGTSISEAGTPVPIRAQLRLHRVIENAFARVQAAH